MNNPQQSRDLIRKTFANDFDRDRFLMFIDRLLKNADFSKHFTQAGKRVFTVSQDKVDSFECIAQFTDVDANKIDILIVNLRRESTIERGRTSLRNFAAEYLKSERGFGKAAVLAAYVVKDANGGYAPQTEWRFSFVTLETELVQQESGKFKEKTSRLTPAKRFSFLVGDGQRTHTAQKQFVDLIQSQSSPTLKQIEDAFSVEKVTKDFYEEYERLFKRVKGEINDLRDKQPSLDKYFEENFIQTADFAKKLLGQIVFLYFLQRKGWFGVPPDGKWGDGDKRYLRKLFNDRNDIAKSYSSYKRKSPSFFHNVLEPLFYEALAYKHPNDVFTPFNAKVPFLNGGLFEPTYEHGKIFIDLPDELFSNRDLVKAEEDADGILDIFDRYNFTVNEAERLEKEVAIDPEMLGHVFENLLVKEERGQSGTYYTPQVIVSYMCRQSLQNYLATHLLDAGNSKQLTLGDIKDFVTYADIYAEHEALPTTTHEHKRFSLSIRKSAPDIDRCLRDVKICDPAIGSGAFPVGLLHEIVRLRSSLVTLWKDKSEDELAREYSSYALKRYAIENSIYGVDIDQGAVDIARLRLWLSLIVDEDDLKDNKALPNLDYKIMQGNSLLDEYDGLSLVPPDFVRRETPQVGTGQDDNKALLQKLSTEYVEEGLRSSKHSTKALRLLRDIKDIKRRIEKNTAQPTVGKLQSNLLETSSQTAAILDELNEIHQRIIDEKDRDAKKTLRSQAERLLLKYINTYLDERESNMRTQIASTKEKLHGEIVNVRRALKKDAETAEVMKLRRRLSMQEGGLKEFLRQRIELKKFLDVRSGSRNNDTDLTKIEIADNITFRMRPFFLWELQFGDVFRRSGVTDPSEQGFDIVIANPPYIRQEKIKEYKAAFERGYPYVYDGKADILVYFYAKAIAVLRDRGTLTFITSNKYFRAGYGEKLRGFLTANSTIKQIIDFSDAPVFEAAAYASIIILQKGGALSETETRVWTFPQNEVVENFEEEFNRSGFEVSQGEFKSDGWRLERPEVSRLLEKLRTRGTPLGKYVNGRFYRGVVTGLNKAFVVDGETRRQLIKKDRSAKDLFKPYLRGRNIKRWQVDADDLWLLFIPWHFPMHDDETIRGASTKPEKEFKKSYPHIHQYLSGFREELEARNQEETGIRYEWYTLQRWAADYWEEFEQPKIIYPDIFSEPSFAWDEKGFFTGNTAYFIPTHEKWLTAVLNSSAIAWFYSQLSNRIRGGYMRAFSDYMEQVPIPDAEPWQKEILERFVDYILLVKKCDEPPTLVINYFESILNGLIYELFLAEELHSAGKRFFEPLRNADLPVVTSDSRDGIRVIQKLFQTLSDVNHPVRKNLYSLDKLESIRIMNGK